MGNHTAVKPAASVGLGIKDASRNAVLGLLDRILADEYVLLTAIPIEYQSNE